MQKKNTTREAWDTAWAWIIGTKWGFCTAAIVGAIIISLFAGIFLQIGIIGAICGAIIWVGLLISTVWLINIIRISVRHKRDTKAALSKLQDYFSTGNPISKADITKLSKVVDLNELPIDIRDSTTVALGAILAWEGQSNVIYTGTADKDIITVNFAVVGHNYTPNESRLGLCDFSIRTIGYAKKNSVFKVFYGSQILGSVSVQKNFMGIFESIDHRKADVIINGYYDEIQTRLCKIIGNKAVWEKTLDIPLNLNKGEKKEFNFNL
jgi:hypothetical protein